jgi:hypothetical protein
MKSDTLDSSGAGGGCFLGAGMIPPGSTLLDWPISEGLEPYHDNEHDKVD